MNLKAIFNDEAGVSPIVATLVLVVVAIAGAAAVGTIMGSFSSDVSEEANSGDVMGASSTELLIAGSTTVQPVSELLAEAFMEEHQGIKVTVQGGGSGAGISSAGLGIVDIGAASRKPKQTEMDKFEDIVVHEIGGSAVVVIVSDDLGDINATKAEVVDAFVNETFAGSLSSVSEAFQRSEASGTEDTFVDYIGSDINSDIEGKVGNGGVLKAVADSDSAIGFVDYGYAAGSDDVNIVGLMNSNSGSYGYNEIDGDAIEDELASMDGSAYETELVRTLNYITNGQPNSVVQSYLDFCMSPAAAEYFAEVGYVPVLDYQ